MWTVAHAERRQDMKREFGWFRIGSGLILSLLLLAVVPACKPLIEVTVHAQCSPPAATTDHSPPPTGCPNGRWPNGSCR
jgi:hypothetical protein